MYMGTALSFGLIKASCGGLALYSIVLSNVGDENGGSSAKSERSLLDALCGAINRHFGKEPFVLDLNWKL